MADVSLQSVLDQTRYAIDAGDTERAIGMAQHILQFAPTLIEGHRLLGEAYLNADQPEQAEAAFQVVLQADPENIPAYYGLGLAHQRLGQPEAAIRAFEMALEIQPNLAELRTQLLRLYAETPGSAGQFRLSRSGLGRLYARGQMYSQAVDEFRAVLETEPDRDDVRVALAETLWRDGQEDEAGDWCRETIERRPRLHKPTLIAGYLQLAAGEPEGEELWRRAAQQEPSLQVASTLFEVLPPTTLPELTLPTFDEAAWRAAQSAAIATAPVDGAEAVPVVVVDDDVFGDSLAAAPHSPPEEAPEAAPAEAPAPEGDDAELSDNDLLAQLLGFAEDPVQTAEMELAPGGSIPMETITLDPTDDALHGEVEPLPDSFSFDEWSFDDELVSATPPGQGARGVVRPFSLHEPDTNASDSPTDPFALGDPAVEEMEPRAEQPAPHEPPKGISAPFSLDNWGTIPGLENNPEAQDPRPAEIEPVALRDLGLAGQGGQPNIGHTPRPTPVESHQVPVQPATQQVTGTSAGHEGELPAWARAREDTDEEAEVPQWLRDQFAQTGHTAAAEGPPPTGKTDEQAVSELDIAPFSLDDLGLEDTDLVWGEPGERAPTAVRGSQEAEPEPFSFAELGLDEGDFDELRLEEPATAGTSAPNDVVMTAPAAGTGMAQDGSPELADLGLTDDELAHFGDQPGIPPAEEPAHVALADLGLTDEELASFSAGDQETAGLSPAQDDRPFDWIIDEDNAPDQDTLEDASRLEGVEGRAPAVPSAPSVHEAETQPFAVAAEKPAGGSDHDSLEPVLPAGPPELSRFYERLEADPDNHTVRLALARLSEQKGDTDRALEQYRQLIRRGALIEPVVEDLQELVTGDYERPMLRRIHRLLGDAYTRQNRLEEALDEYTWT